MQTKIIERYFFFGLLTVTLIFAFMIFRPFWTILVLGASISVILFPIYKWLEKRGMKNWIAAFLTIVFFVIILLGPILGIGILVFDQTQDVYNSVIRDGGTGAFMSTLNESINKIVPQGVTLNIANELSNFISSISSNIAKILSVTFSALLSFILMILVMFYFLKDGEHFRKLVKVLSPLSDTDDEKIIKKLSDAVNAVIKGYLLIALIQGTLMGIGLWFFDVPNPALWGLVAAIASLLPMIGTALVAVPSIIFLLATSNPGAAVGLLIWSVLMVGTIDNFLSPFFVGERIKIPSILVLFSVLGGIYLLGPIGILMGPLTVSLLYTLISIYRNEYRQTGI